MAIGRLRGQKAKPVKGSKSVTPSLTTAPAPPPDTRSDTGELMVSAGKYARNMVLHVFEDIGGRGAMAEWASENKGDFYTKLFGKTITREAEVEHKAGGIEDILADLDAEADGAVVDVEAEDVS